jgi:NAD(P)H-hydrate epimerase
VALAAARPELICIGAPDAQAIGAHLAAATVIAIGPGLGQSPWARGMLEAVLAAGKPLVIDADALNLMAEGEMAFPVGSIITPHPGEAARLLNCAASDIQNDRAGALNRLALTPGVVVVLKGASTLVGGHAHVSSVCEFGNPGMAVAGMGDVLTGAIAGVYAQCRDAWLAARAAVLLHARAGDYVAAQVGDRGLLAVDVAAALPRGIRGAPS